MLRFLNRSRMEGPLLRSIEVKTRPKRNTVTHRSIKWRSNVVGNVVGNVVCFGTRLCFCKPETLFVQRFGFVRKCRAKLLAPCQAPCNNGSLARVARPRWLLSEASPARRAFAVPANLCSRPVCQTGSRWYTGQRHTPAQGPWRPACTRADQKDRARSPSPVSSTRSVPFAIRAADCALSAI